MIINAVGLVAQTLSALVSSHKAKAPAEATSLLADNSSSVGKQYNVKNMSLDDLKQMASNLLEAGKISAKEKDDIFSQSSLLQQKTGVASDTKLDLLQLFQQQIDALKTQPGSKDAQSFESSLELLNGVQASSTASIPKFV